MAEPNINKIFLRSQRNDAHFQFHTEVAALIREIGAGMLFIGDLAPKYAAQLSTLDDALKVIVKSPITEELLDADKARDETYRGLAALVKAMSCDTDPAARAAAHRVQIVLDTYGNVAVKNYEEETGAVYNLVQDLKSAKYAGDVAAAGLTVWVDRLARLNNAFTTLLTSRDNETAARSHIVVKDARRDIDNTYRKIAFRVNSHVGGEVGAAEISAFVTKMNIIIKRFNALKRHHHGHGGEEDGQGEDGHFDSAQ